CWYVRKAQRCIPLVGRRGTSPVASKSVPAYELRFRSVIEVRASMHCNHTTSASDKRVRNIEVGGQPNRLDLEVILDGLDPRLTTDARFLVAAERRGKAGRAVVVDPDRPRLELVGHQHRALEIASPYRRRQTEIDIVPDADRIRFVFKGDDRQNGSEHFFLSDTHIVANTRENGGLDE